MSFVDTKAPLSDVCTGVFAGERREWRLAISDAVRQVATEHNWGVSYRSREITDLVAMIWPPTATSSVESITACSAVP